MPIAAVFHKLAAVAVPFTLSLPLEIAPPPQRFIFSHIDFNFVLYVENSNLLKQMD